MANINYRGNGAWGDGIGRQLTSPEIDSNFFQLNTYSSNRLWNGSGEMGTFGWTATADSIVAPSSNSDGSYLSPSPTANSTPKSVEWESDLVTIGAGTVIASSFDVIVNNFAGAIYANFKYYDSDRTLIGYGTKFAVTGANGIGYKTYSFSQTTPDNTKYVSFVIGVTNSTWNVIRWKNVKIGVRNTFQTPYNSDANWEYVFKNNFAWQNRVAFNGSTLFYRASNLPTVGYISPGRSENNADLVWVNPQNATDQKVWEQVATSNQMLFRTINDANNSAQSWLTVTRNGLSVNVINFSIRPTFGGNTAWDTGNFNPANYVAKTGDDMIGPLGLSAAAGASNQIFFKRGTGKRFEIGMDGSTEGTGDTGSAFYLSAYDNNGAFKSKLLNISRDTGRLDYAGNLWVSRAAIDTGIHVNANAGFNRTINFLSTGSIRWQLLANAAAETGGNAGSDFAISRCSDAGVFIDNPFSITRSTGRAMFAHRLTVDTVGQGTNEGASITFNGVKKTIRGLFFNTSGKTRWDLSANAEDETGSNNGTNIVFNRYDDNGNYISSPLAIDRSTGVASFEKRPVFSGNTAWDTGNLNPYIGQVTGGDESDLPVNTWKTVLTTNVNCGPRGVIQAMGNVRVNLGAADASFEVIARIGIRDTTNNSVIYGVSLVATIGPWINGGVAYGACQLPLFFMLPGLVPGRLYEVRIEMTKNRPTGPTNPQSMVLQWTTM